MSIEVPAYQAAGAIRKYLDEAEMASLSLNEEVHAALAFNAEVKTLKSDMTMSTWLEMIELVAKRLNGASDRLELHHDLIDQAEEFFVAAESMSEDHRNMIAVPAGLIDVVLPYLDDAFEDFVQCLYDIGAEMVESQVLEREAIRASVPRFAPAVEIGSLFAA